MTSMFDAALAERLRETGVLAVVVLDRAEDGPALARALLSGGVNAVELTLRTDAAFEAIRRIRLEVPEMIVGAGTVLATEQVSAAIRAGAVFGVSPGCNPRVLAAAQDARWPFAPGVAVPSDVERALEFGCRLLKLFPAEPLGGVAYLRAMAAPYVHLGVKFIPLGGVTQGNLPQWLAEPLVAAVGGSWLAPRDVLRRGDWATVRTLAAEARQAANLVRAAQSAPGTAESKASSLGGSQA